MSNEPLEEFMNWYNDDRTQAALDGRSAYVQAREAFYAGTRAKMLPPREIGRDALTADYPAAYPPEGSAELAGYHLTAAGRFRPEHSPGLIPSYPAGPPPVARIEDYQPLPWQPAPFEGASGAEKPPGQEPDRRYAPTTTMQALPGRPAETRPQPVLEAASSATPAPAATRIWDGMPPPGGHPFFSGQEDTDGRP